jgi:hypothetical protein
MRTFVLLFIAGILGICTPIYSQQTIAISVSPATAYAGDIVTLIPLNGAVFNTGIGRKHSISVGNIPATIKSESPSQIRFEIPFIGLHGSQLVKYSLDDGPSGQTSISIIPGKRDVQDLPSGSEPDPSKQYGKPIEAGKNPKGLPRGPVVYNPPGGHTNSPYSNCNPMHVIDGAFSGKVAGGKYEWSDITPMKTRFSNIYVDYCAESGIMYFLNDWDWTSIEPDKSTCYAYFEMSSGNGEEKWEIRIYNDKNRGISVKRNGVEVSKSKDIVIGGAYSFSSSPLFDYKHTIYEYALKVKPGNFMIPVLSSPIQSLGPLVKCNDTGYALVKDPSYYHGIMNDTGIVLRKDERYVPLAGAAGLATEPMVIAGTLGRNGSSFGATGAVGSNPNCLSKHEVDGKFTRFPDSSKEWSQVKAARGRYSDLYADYCDGTLYILNDWVLGSEEPDKENCYNLFELTTGGGTQHWGIYVYHNIRKGIRVFLNGQDVSSDTSIVKGGKFGMDSSARDPKPHTIYEFAIKADEGAWKMFFCDPGPSSFCDNDMPNVARSIQSFQTGFSTIGSTLISKQNQGFYGWGIIANPIRSTMLDTAVFVLRTNDNTSDWGGSKYEVNISLYGDFVKPIDVFIAPDSTIGKKAQIISKRVSDNSIYALIDSPNGFTNMGELLRVKYASRIGMRDTTEIRGNIQLRNSGRVMRTVPVETGYILNDGYVISNAQDFRANILPMTKKEGDYLLITFSLDIPENVSIRVYDELGRTLRSLIKKGYSIGDHSEQLSLNGLPKGMLYVMLTTDDGKSVTVPFLNKE